VSLADENHELVDLFGKGLPDILEMSREHVRYWRNLGALRFDEPRPMTNGPAVALNDPGVQIIDANGDARADVVVTSPGLSGYFPMSFDRGWDRNSFQPWNEGPGFDLKGAGVRLVDLDGDGVTDAIRSESSLMCYFNDPARGWYATRLLPRRALEEFPDVDLTSPYVKWADMNGDGLMDVVVVGDGRIDYWASFGKGDFGPRMTMANSPRLPYSYDPRRVLLGDIDGDGAADLVYVDADHVTVWLNRSGNAWSDPITVHGTPFVSSMDSVRLVDLLGRGVAGLLWSPSSWIATRPRMFFLDFTGGSKPYLLEQVDNNIGGVTRVRYRSSTDFYLQDLGTSIAWRTPLPFPVQVVAQTESIDQLSGSKLISKYAYHHGYWDGVEREFRGFGRVDHTDTETFEESRLHSTATGSQPTSEVPQQHFSPPTQARTWFHLGSVAEEGEAAALDCTGEFWNGDRPAFDQSALQAVLQPLSTQAKRDALRSLRGRMLRVETYAVDGSGNAHRPFSISEQAHSVAVKVPPTGPRSLGVFFPYQFAARTTHWDRGNDPQSQIVFTGSHDDYGQPQLEVRIAVPRGRDYGSSAAVNVAPFLATATVTAFARRDDSQCFIVDRVASRSVYELVDDLRAAAQDPRPTAAGVWDQVQRWQRGQSTVIGMSLIEQSLHHYDGNPYEGLDLGQIGVRGILSRVEQLVCSEAQLHDGYRSGVAILNPAEEPPYLRRGASVNWTTEYPQQFRSQISQHRHTPPRGTPTLGGFIHYQSSNSRAAGFFAAVTQRAYNTRGMLIGDRDALGNETTIEYGDGYDLLPTRLVDPALLETVVEYDYRVLQPGVIKDFNDSATRYRYTPLGLLESVAVLGRQGHTEGDLRDEPSTMIEYDFQAFVRDRQPIFAHTTRRTTHTNIGSAAPAATDTLETREYSDGFGRVLQTRALAEDLLVGGLEFGHGVLPADQSQNASVVGRRRGTGEVNVVVNGWQRFDNKGRVVEQYEPFFSTGWNFRLPAERERGARGEIYYDARGRVARTVNPDGSEQLTVYGRPNDLSRPGDFSPSPWETYFYDANDNAGRTPSAPSSAWAQSDHFNTPPSTVMDALGRVVERTDRNGPDPTQDWFTARTEYDIKGNVTSIADAQGRVVFRSVSDSLGRPMRIEQLDGGTRRTVYDAAGDVIEERGGTGSLILHARDVLRRPGRLWARDQSSEQVTLRQILVYGDSSESGLTRLQARRNGLLGRLYQHYDDAGLLQIGEYDFKGNVLEKHRQVLADSAILSVFASASSSGWSVSWYRTDWQPSSGDLAAHASRLLEPTPHRTSYRYDALNRLINIEYPADVAGKRIRVDTRYNRAGLADRTLCDGRTIVDLITYNAKGQRTLIVYGDRDAAGTGPRVMTRYCYDERRFRLLRLRTEPFETRDVLTLVPIGAVLQDIAYDYDPVGNIVSIHDRTPGSGLPIQSDVLDRFLTYDPLYRLLSATGRECDTPLPRPWDVDPRCADPTRTRGYREEYVYDRANNLREIRHQPASGSAPTRYLEIVGNSNRLAALRIGDATTAPRFVYQYDSAGNLTAEATDRYLEWDYHQRLRSFRVQTTGAEPSQYAQYFYGASGERVKKVVRKQGGRVETTIYVDGLFEQHRVATGATTQQHTIAHVLDGDRTILTLRAGTDPDDATPAVKFHLVDHLSSSVLLLDQTGNWVAREEFSPYGETTFGGFARKRFRFIGRERDNESGLCYHSVRYYLPWVGRWASLDPGGPVDGLNLYAYARCGPMTYSDPTGFGAEQPKQGQRAENITRTVFEATGQMDQLKAAGVENSTQITIEAGRGGSRADILTDRFSFEVTSRNVDTKTYRNAQGVNTRRVADSVVQSKQFQIAEKHEPAFRRNRLGPMSGEGPLRERLLVVVEGEATAKEIATIRAEIRDQLRGSGIKSGVISASRLEQLAEQKGRLGALTAKGVGSAVKYAGWALALVAVVSLANTARKEGAGAALTEVVEGLVQVHGGVLNASEPQMLEIDRVLTGMRNGDLPTPNEDLGGGSLSRAERNAELEALARDTLGFVPEHWRFSN